MTIEDIKKLIAKDENRTLELKKTTGELKDGMHSACAFLNTDGGWLVFGITPTSLKIVGQEVTDNTQREIANALGGIEPAIDVTVEYIDVPEHPDNKVIALHLDNWVWGKEPYTYNGCPYIRVESTTRQMPREMYEERLKAAKPHKFGWEKQIADDFNIDDMDEERIRAAVRLGVDYGRLSATANGESIESLLRKFKFMKDGKLTNGAVMLFAKDTSEYPQLLLRMARFVGTDKNEFLDNQRRKGNFFDLLDAGMDFAYKHLNLGGKIVGLHRDDKLEIPIKALREALINAYCHRIYDSSSASVSMAIFDDRLEIVNPGRLPHELTVESMMLPHDSFPTNPDIAEFMFKTSYLDSWGSGVQRMIDACTEAKVPLPRYELRPGGVAIIFDRPKKRSAESRFTKDFTKDFIKEIGIQLTERQKEILLLISKDSTITSQKISEKISQKNAATSRTVLKDLKYLQGVGLLARVGGRKDGVWKILIP